MEVSVSDAKGQLTDLVRRAEAGDEIILTRHGHAAVRLTPMRKEPDKKARTVLLKKLRGVGLGRDPNKASFVLYDEDGFPI